MATNNLYDNLKSQAEIVNEQRPPLKFANYDEETFFIKNGGVLLLLNLLTLLILGIVSLLQRKKVSNIDLFSRKLTAL